MANLGSTTQKALEETPPLKKHHHPANTASQTIISINTTVNCSIEPKFKYISFLTLLPHEGNISKQKEHALQWYTNFLWGLYYVTPVKVCVQIEYIVPTTSSVSPNFTPMKMRFWYVKVILFSLPWRNYRLIFLLTFLANAINKQIANLAKLRSSHTLIQHNMLYYCYSQFCC